MTYWSLKLTILENYWRIACTQLIYSKSQKLKQIFVIRILKIAAEKQNSTLSVHIKLLNTHRF